MKTIAVSALIYYLTWVPFFLVKDQVITVTVGGVLLASSEVKHLAIYYFPLTLLSFFPILVWLVANRNKKIRKLEQKLENAKQLLAETETRLMKKERVKYNSLRGF